MSQRQEELINNFLDEGIHNFNQSQKEKKSQNFQSNNINNSHISNISVNQVNQSHNSNSNFNNNSYLTNKTTNYENSLVPNLTYKFEDNLYQNIDFTLDIKKENDNKNKNCDYYNDCNNNLIYNNNDCNDCINDFNNNNEEPKIIMKQIKIDYSDKSELKRLNDNLNFVNELRNITLYPKLKNTFDIISKKEKTNFNKMTREVIKRDNEKETLPEEFNFKFKDLDKKKTEEEIEKDKEYIICRECKDENLEEFQKPFNPQISDTNNFDLYMQKRTKFDKENKIFKEKYDFQKAEYDIIDKLIQEEKKKNNNLQNDIARVKKKQRKLEEIEELNDALCETRDNLEKKLEQSKELSLKQNELIQKLQHEIQEMRKTLRMKTPF